MQFVQLQGDASVSALVQRVYGLSPGSAAATAAQNALLAANPHLTAISTLPAGTPVVLPPGPASGTAATAAVSADPRRAAVLSTVQSLAAAVPLRSATSSQPDATQQAAITILQADLAAFAKLHSG